jgi:hypothetical protein
MEPLTIEKLEIAIKIAKQVLEENPNDTWVAKGLVEMEKELEKMISEKFR